MINKYFFVFLQQDEEVKSLKTLVYKQHTVANKQHETQKTTLYP